MGIRETLLAAVTARVQRVATEGDWSAALEPTALNEARSLAECVADDLVDLEVEYSLGWLFYCRAQALPPAEAAPDWANTIRCFVPCFISGWDNLPETLTASLAMEAVPTAMGLLSQAMSTPADPASLDFTVDLWRRIERSIPDGHPLQAGVLSNFGRALRLRFERTEELADLDEAVEACRSAVRITPDNHPDQAPLLSNLGFTLRLRFERTQKLADADEAVRVGRAAVRATVGDAPDRAVPLSNLAIALRKRFELTRQRQDLIDAVEAGRAAVSASPDGHPDQAVALSHLGRALLLRFRMTRESRDLEQAVSASRAAVRDTPADHPDLAVPLDSLGLVLQTRFLHTGDMADLDEAVEVGRAAVAAAPDDRPDQPARLSNLGLALRDRYDRMGDVGDLEEAVSVGRAALRALPENHPDRAGYLSILGVAIQDRFSRLGDAADVDEAVELARAAVRTSLDDDGERITRLSDLGRALRMRFQLTRELRDLDEAVEVHRASIAAFPEGALRRPTHLSNLGSVLRLRFEHAGDVTDLDEAVEVGRAAVRSTPEDPPDRASHLTNLSLALVKRFELNNAAEDLEEALSALEETAAMVTASPRQRVFAARVAARLTASSAPARAAGLLEQAVLMLPEVAPRRLRRGDQQHALGIYARDLAADAIALALVDTSIDSQERPLRALRLAEAGRAVLLSQALDTRNDLTDLHDRHPDLAERFFELRELLDQDLTVPFPAPQDRTAAITMSAAERAEATGRNRHGLAAELEALLVSIRNRDGFSAFGLAPTAHDLLAEAAQGPVVTFNVSRYRSDAVLLTRKGIVSCPLPRLTRDRVVEQLNAFYGALAEASAPDGDRIAAQRMLCRVLEWLWEAAAEPVLSALAGLGEVTCPTETGQPLPRVWWAPGGLLGLLPLHAAGFHTDSGQGPQRCTVLDRVISSYTPTVRALRHARRPRPQPAGDSQSLIVAMPTTPGLSPLRHVTEEARRIRPLLPHPIQLTEPGSSADGSYLSPNDDLPTTAAVIARLPKCSIAHFACHGDSNRSDPSRSQLFLHDHDTTPLTVSALAQVNLDRAQLAFLSACSTADPGGLELLDEAIHLTSAFQLAGFPHVVGTLWPINDRQAVEIAESFYTHLTTAPDGRLDPELTATALHRTVRELRDRYPATPSLWAAYLHAGA